MPLFPLHVSGFSAVNTGLPLGSMYSDPEKSFWAQVRTQEQYGYEYMPLFGYAAYGAWELGGEVKFPEGEWDQAPSVIRYPITAEEDVARIETERLPDVDFMKLREVAPAVLECQFAIKTKNRWVLK